MAFPLEVRRVLYTTNTIESLHMQLRKALKVRGQFPSDETALKLLLPRAPSRDPALDQSQFAILYPYRFTLAG